MRGRCGGRGLRETRASLVDDGKHAFSVIEVDTSLVEAKWEGGLEGGWLGARWGGCGFKGVGCLGRLKIVLE